MKTKPTYQELENEVKILRQKLSNKPELTHSMLLDNIMHSSTEMSVAATDIKLNVIFFNPRAEEIFGYKASEVIGKNLTEIHAMEKVEFSKIEKAIGIVKKTGKYVYYVNSETNEGAKYYKSTVSGIWDTKKQLTGFVLFTEDITERIKVENKMKELNEELAVQNEEYLTLNEELNENIIRIQNMNMELEEAKEKTEESEAKFKKLSDLTFEGILLHNKGFVVDANLSFTKMFGYKSKEIIGKNIIELVVDKSCHKIISENIIKNYALPYQVLGVKKDGSLFPIEVEARDIKNEAADTTVRVVVVRDITERKKMEDNLRQFKKIVDLTVDHMSLIDTNYTYRIVNNSYLKAHNKTQDQIVGYSIAELLGNEVFENVIKEKIDLCLTGKVVKYSDWFDFSDGEKKYMDVSYYPYFNDKQEISGILVVSRDVTEHKTNELKLKTQNDEYESLIEELTASDEEIRATNEELIATTEALKESNEDLVIAKEKAEESENKLKVVVNSIPDLFFHKDINGVYQGCNENFGIFTNKKIDKIIGSTDYELFPKELADMFRFNDNEMLKSGKLRQNDEWVTYPDGHKEFLDTIKIPYYNSKNEIQGIIGISRDITERLRKEEELIIAKEKAEESDRLKTEFLNNMSHEIRTPLNGIMGFSKMLDKSAKSEDKRNFYVSIIQNSSNQLLRIIDDILEISQLGTKQVKVKKEEVCLNNLLLEQFSIFDIKAKENKTPLYLKKNLSDEDCIIFTDKSKLTKILSNLLENALKFTKEGYIEFGYVLVETRQGVSLQEKTIQLYVKDTGIGIATDKQKIVFDRFSQENIGIASNFGGLGLGLSIAKENAELLGGEIRLESEKDKGSVFYVTIPYKKVIEIKDDKPYNKKRKTIEKQDVCKILIAEDEEVNLLYLETLLEDQTEMKFDIIHAKNGQEAIEICKNNSEIDLVLMDLKMPIMNGYEATSRIRKFRDDIPIIAQTAYSTKNDIEKAKDAGCDDFISKPINEDDFIAMINKYL